MCVYYDIPYIRSRYMIGEMLSNMMYLVAISCRLCHVDIIAVDIEICMWNTKS